MPQVTSVHHFSGQNGSDWSVSFAGRPSAARPFFRADLHVHTRYSGPGHLHGPGLKSGIGEPEALYSVARARGMDLVTFTDIDTIDGCLDLLNRHPDVEDFIVSEEIVAADPRTGYRVHVLLYDLNEAQHREAQRLKGDVRELMTYARRERIVASLSPSLRGLPADAWAGHDMEELLSLFERFEVKNGTLSRSHNNLAARLVQQAAGGRRLGVTAGSNAHGPARVGRTVTVSPARSPREFLSHLRDNRTWASGEDGSVWDASADLSRLIAGEYRALLGRRNEPRGRRRLTRALLAAPLHLLGATFFKHGLRRVRADARVRNTWRLLDRIEVESFQARSKTYVPAAPPTGAAPGPSTQRQPTDASLTTE